LFVSQRGPDQSFASSSDWPVSLGSALDGTAGLGVLRIGGGSALHRLGDSQGQPRRHISRGVAITAIAAWASHALSRTHPRPVPYFFWWGLLWPRGFLAPEPLKKLLEPRAGERILELGPASASTRFRWRVSDRRTGRDAESAGRASRAATRPETRRQAGRRRACRRSGLHVAWTVEGSSARGRLRVRAPDRSDRRVLGSLRRFSTATVGHDSVTRSYGLRVAVHGASVRPSLMRLLADAPSIIRPVWRSPRQVCRDSWWATRRGISM
jgi:hypothetical protein